MFYYPRIGTKFCKAIPQNFKLTSINPKKVRCAALEQCISLELCKLVMKIKKSRFGHLEAFFTIKAHKEGSPFRTLATEKGTWQRLVSRFLQKKLSTLHRGPCSGAELTGDCGVLKCYYFMFKD